jgi:hypothetical protein
MALHVSLLRARGLPPEAGGGGSSWWPRGASSSSTSAEPCHASLRLLPDGPKRVMRAAEPRDDGELVRSASATLCELRCASGC